MNWYIIKTRHVRESLSRKYVFCFYFCFYFFYFLINFNYWIFLEFNFFIFCLFWNVFLIFCDVRGKGVGVMPLYGKWVCLWPYMVLSFTPWVFGLNKTDHSLLLTSFRSRSSARCNMSEVKPKTLYETL